MEASKTEWRGSTVEMTRFTNVSGYDQRQNDLLVGRRPPTCASTNHLLVFFPGDIQNFLDRSSSEFLQWSMEASVHCLAERFPHSIIVAIRASLHNHLSAVYSNFVDSSPLNYGVPTYDANDTLGWRHLTALLQSATIDAKLSPRYSISLVGFSKGCVPLWQLLLSIDAAHQCSLTERIDRVYLLDAGHNGTHDVYPATVESIERLCRRRLRIHLHTTPYQMRDPARPWILNEARVFVRLCRQKGILAEAQYHADSSSAPIDMTSDEWLPPRGVRRLADHFHTISYIGAKAL